MDRDAIRLLATVGAMKLLLGRLYTLVYATAKLTPAQVSQLHMGMIARLPEQSLVGTTDSALSDLLSAEIESEMTSMLQGIEQEFAKATPPVP